MDPSQIDEALGKATSLARQGYFVEALQLLRTVPADLTHDRLDVLDLCARIYAQQGRWLDAERYWQEAIRIDPGNPVYRDGLNTAQGRGNDLRPIVQGAIALLLALAIICTWRLWHYADSMQTQTADLKSQLANVEQLTRTQQELIDRRLTETDARNSVATLERRLIGTEAALNATTQALERYRGENQDAAAAYAKAIQGVQENVTNIGRQLDAANGTIKDSVKALSADTAALRDALAAQNEQRQRVLDLRLKTLDESVLTLTKSIADLSKATQATADTDNEQLRQFSRTIAAIELRLPPGQATTRPTSQPSH
jgi:tetratricopeptide (TPR) repeat protein